MAYSYLQNYRLAEQYLRFSIEQLIKFTQKQNDIPDLSVFANESSFNCRKAGAPLAFCRPRVYIQCIHGFQILPLGGEDE